MATQTQTEILSAQTYYTTARENLRARLPGVNLFALPQIEKIVLNTGIGRFENKERQEIVDYLERLTGQIPKVVRTNKSIASFKVRKGHDNGVMVTLRGKKMLDFLLLLIYIALPRTRDFRGLKRGAFDKNFRTYSIGIPSASIFPQIGFDASVQFGLQVNIVFKHPDQNNRLLLEELRFPFVRK